MKSPISGWLRRRIRPWCMLSTVAPGPGSRSNWAGYPRANQPTPTLQDISSLRNNFLYRMISGTRRVMDYLAAQPEIDAANMGCGGG